MQVFTVETLPDNMKIKKLFSMIILQDTLQTVKTGLFTTEKITLQKVYDDFTKMANSEANAVIGVGVNIDVVNGLQVVTMYGTPVILEYLD